MISTNTSNENVIDMTNNSNNISSTKAVTWVDLFKTKYGLVLRGKALPLDRSLSLGEENLI